MLTIKLLLVVLSIGVKAKSSKPVSVFFGLNYKYLEIYHEIIKHIIWLDRKIEVSMVLDFM